MSGEKGSGAVVVVGFRMTGRAVAAFLRGRGERLVIVEDDPTDERRQEAAALDADFVAHPNLEELRQVLRGSRLVVPSPGIPVRHPVYQAAAELAVPVHSELELGWERLAARPAPQRPGLVAVTGTNGKTTVTSLVAAMLVQSGLRAVPAGNIGLPFVEAAALDVDVLVTEVSSFQLQYTDQFHPAVSCWLNLAEDHLDWHPTTEHYAAAKARIWANQWPDDVAVLNADDLAVGAAADHGVHGLPTGVRRVTFGLQRRADYYLDGDVLTGPDGLRLVRRDEMVRALPLDVANSLAAAATALAAGASVAGCREALRQFIGLPHRVALVAEHDGVRWYDDSKATTPASVLAAVAGFDSVVLIAGGRNKGLDLGVLGQAVPPVRAVVAIGEAAGEVEAAFAGRAPVDRAATMAEAVARAGHIAVPGDAVLLSPGCASFDWYRSYAERGEEFAALVAAREMSEGGRVATGASHIREDSA